MPLVRPATPVWPASVVVIQGVSTMSVLDGELVGDVLWVFDAFEVNGKALTKQPYHERYHWLLRVEAVMESPSIKIVRAAETHTAKVALIKKARAEHAEGVCFINKNAPYEPGKPNTGGNNLRWKFRASASLIVAEHHPSKNSLDVMLADGTRIGSVTMIGRERGSSARVRSTAAGRSVTSPVSGSVKW